MMTWRTEVLGSRVDVLIPIWCSMGCTLPNRAQDYETGGRLDMEGRREHDGVEVVEVDNGIRWGRRRALTLVKD